ncbi:MAG: ABC transporter ATP-binding protein [Candidatus Hydrothermia bacterium]
MIILEVQNLIKYYGNFQALKGITFHVEEGEIFALIGPNGAGKSTTLKIISTLLRPSGGTVIFRDTATQKEYELPKDAGIIRRFISYLPEEAGAYKNLRGIDYLKLMAELYAENSNDKKEMVERAIEIAGLGNRIKDRISSYSKGMTRKLLVARALMHKPKLAILDEPTSGLDVINSIEVRNIIKEYAREGVTVVLSSHNMLEVEYLSDTVAFIHEGNIIEQGKPEDLKKRYGAKNLEEVFLEAVK